MRWRRHCISKITSYTVAGKVGDSEVDLFPYKCNVGQCGFDNGDRGNNMKCAVACCFDLIMTCKVLHTCKE